MFSLDFTGMEIEFLSSLHFVVHCGFVSHVQFMNEAEDFREAGYSLAEYCHSIGMTAADAYQMNYTILNLQEAKFSGEEIAGAGYSLDDLLSSHIAHTHLREAGDVLE